MVYHLDDWTDKITYKIVDVEYKYFPSQYNLEDSRLKANVFHDNYSNRVLKIENKTDMFVAVSSISAYFNGKVYTLNDVNLNIPPYSSSSIKRFDKSIITFLKISDLNKKVEYGLAIKYTDPVLGKEKTLYKVDYFKP